MAPVRRGYASQSLRLWFNGLSMFYSATCDINCFLSLARLRLCSMEAIHTCEMCPVHNRSFDGFWVECAHIPSYLQTPLEGQPSASRRTTLRLTFFLQKEVHASPQGTRISQVTQIPWDKADASWHLMMVPEILEKLRNIKETELYKCKQQISRSRKVIIFRSYWDFF